MSLSLTEEIEAFDFLGSSDAVLRDPYPFYALLRTKAPVYFDRGHEAFLVSRYLDVLEVIKQPNLFSSAPAYGGGGMARQARLFDQLEPEVREKLTAAMADGRISLGQPPKHFQVATLLISDPPEHGRYRTISNKIINARKAQQWAPRVRQIADELIDGFIADGRVEFVRDFAHILTVRVVGELLGGPTEDWIRLERLFGGPGVVTADLGNPASMLKEMLDALEAGGGQVTGGMFGDQTEFLEYFSDRIDQVRARPIDDDFLSDLVHARDGEGEHLNDEELLSILSTFQLPGHDTTTKNMTTAMYYLVRDPAVQAAVRADRSLCGNLLDESLRFDGSTHYLFRTATADTELGGVTIPAGSQVLMLFASGNRDPEQFTDPDRFDPARQNARTHLTFGQGAHYCIGAHFARVEAECGIGALLARTEHMRFAEHNSFEMTKTLLLRGFRELHLEFTSVG